MGVRDEGTNSWLDPTVVPRRATEEELRRAIALCRYECPDHGCDLEECEDVDEQGVHVYYECAAGQHVFGSTYDPAGGYCPVDDR